MEIKEITKKDYPAWDTFIDSSNNGTIFHKAKFLSYHLQNKFNYLLLAFYKNDKIIACLPGGIQKNSYFSPLGSSYGSIVTGDLTFNEYEEIVDCLLNYLKEKRIKEVFLTPPPIFYLKKQNQIESFLLSYKGFVIDKHLITNAVNLTTFPSEHIENYFTSMHKRAVKKAVKENVTIAFSDNLKIFYDILIENKKKFKTRPTHTLEELKKLRKLFPKDISLMLAYNKNSKPIAGILLFKCNAHTLLAFYISHIYQFQELRAVNLLFYEVIKWAKENNFNWLDLGVSMNTASHNPMEPSRSLIYFKEGIQTRGFLRTTYKLSL